MITSLFIPSIPGRARHVRGLLLALLLPAVCGGHSLAAGNEVYPAFSIREARLSPGSISRVTVATPEGTSVRSGRLVLKFSPPVFLDTPAVSFPGAPPDVTFGLTPLGAGRYAVDFAVPPGAADLGPGPLFVVSGMVLPSLHVGGRVNVMLDGGATDGAGRERSANADALVPLILDPYPLITVHVQDGYDLVPGTTAIIELRTYNPKLISDGQICLRVDRTVFTSVESIAVQGEPDVSYVSGTDDSGALVVRFSSPASSINRFEGAILRIGMKVAEGLPPGLETIVDVDVERSFLRDHSGDVVPLGGESGRFRVAASGP